jgi:aspartate dehydrogenase
MVLSVGALVSKSLYNELCAIATAKGARIYVPSGALAGMDGVFAASQAKLEEVVLTSTKPPEGFKGAPYLSKKGIELDGITEPILLFEGPASEAVKAFPKNVNVAATLSLCGLGPEMTKVRIMADPASKRNKHEVYIRGDFGELRLEVLNVPSPQNPRTSYLAALSAVGCLKKIASGMWIGV